MYYVKRLPITTFALVINLNFKRVEMKKIILILFIAHYSLQIAEAQPTQEWVARYQRPSGSSGIANQMALDKVGNCYVLGNSNVSGGVMVLIKYNSNGDTLWTRSYSQAGNVGVIADSIGNVYAIGLLGQNFGPYDILTIKYNPLGVQQWLKIYDSGGNDEAKDVAMDKSGNVYIGGFTGNQSLIIKYNGNGDTVWTRKYSETNYRFPVVSLILDNQNNVYISGARVHTTNSSNAEFTIKYDSNGNEVWQKIYNGPGSGGEIPFDLKVDGLGNIIVTGASSGIGTGNYDFITFKYNTNGDSLWVKRYNGSGNGNDESYSLDLDDSNNVYITGRSFGSFNEWDYTSIKYNSIGVQQWLIRYPSLINRSGIAYVIRIDRNQNIYITGKSDSSGVNDYVTIKYTQPVSGIEPISNIVPSKYKLLQNYPNPFNPSTKIKYQIVNNNINVNLTVFDIMGREIVTLVNEKQSSGTYQVSFESQNISNGIYFYKLMTEDFTDTKKMILIK